MGKKGKVMKGEREKTFLSSIIIIMFISTNIQGLDRGLFYYANDDDGDDDDIHHHDDVKGR